jgi:hypothetical protein
MLKFWKLNHSFLVECAVWNIIGITVVGCTIGCILEDVDLNPILRKELKGLSGRHFLRNVVEAKEE